MITKVVLPKADANMYEGTIAQWLKTENQSVSKGEPLVEIVTDKAVFELEAPRSGILLKILAPEQSVLPPGYIMAFIGGPGDRLPEVETFNQKLITQFREQQALLKAAKLKKKNELDKTSSPAGEDKIRATPAARRLARQNHLSLAEVKARFKTEIVNEKMVAEYLENK